MPQLSADGTSQVQDTDDAILDDVSNTPAEQGLANGDDAASPAADEKSEPRKLLDVLQDAVKPKEEPEASSAPEAEKPEVDATTTPEPALTDKELAKLPFNRHPDFKRMRREYQALKAGAVESAAKIEALSAPAAQFSNIDAFLKTNEITGPEFVDLLKLGALLKTDPVAAKAEIFKVLIGLDEVTGDAIPPDIRKDIEEGAITEERGRELSRARATAKNAVEREKVATARTETVTSETRARDHAVAMDTALNGWEARVKAKDPDFGAKDQLVADRVVAMNARLGMPDSPEAAVARCQTAYDEVTAHLKSLQPNKGEMKLSPKSGSTAAVVAAPKTLREAIALSI